MAPTTSTSNHHCESEAIDDSFLYQIDLACSDEDTIDTIKQAWQYDGPGFVYLVNHGVDHSILERAIEEARSFFSQTLEKKVGISSEGYSGAAEGLSSKGYIPPDIEGRYSKDEYTDKRPLSEKAGVELNQRESLVFRYPELTNNERPYLHDYEKFIDSFDVNLTTLGDPKRFGEAVTRYCSPNQWPNLKDLPKFMKSIQTYIDAMNKVSNRIFKLLNKLLKEVGGLQYNYDTPMSTFTFAHYPPSQNEGMGIADHTDSEMFTLLYPSYYPLENQVVYTGLQLWHEGTWKNIPHIPGSIIMNQGEILSRLSHGKLRPPVHRVQERNSKERYSLINFCAPNYETLMPDPENPDRFILSGEYYLKRNKFL